MACFRESVPAAFSGDEEKESLLAGAFTSRGESFGIVLPRATQPPSSRQPWVLEEVPFETAAPKPGGYPSLTCWAVTDAASVIQYDWEVVAASR